MTPIQSRGLGLIQLALASLVLSLLPIAAFAQSPPIPTSVPGSFSPAGVGGRAHGGTEFDPLKVASRPRRMGSAMPIHSGGKDVHAGDIVYDDPHIASHGPVAEDIGPHHGEVVYDSGLQGPEFAPSGDCTSCGDGACGSCSAGGCNSCNSWDGCGQPDCANCVAICLPRFGHLQLFGGVQGFKGPRDNGANGNFGFNEGILVSGRAPFIGHAGVGYQLGYRSTQTRLHGDLQNNQSRVQHFVTAGLFRRRPVGLQYGAVYDFLQDDLNQELDFSQMRTEISVRGPRGGELGFQGMFHLNDEGNNNGNGVNVFEPVDQYRFFFRSQFANCSEGRVWIGVSDEDDGIIGGELLIPMSDFWSIEGGFNYLIPEDDTPPQGTIQEAWNIGINLIYHWRGDGRSSLCSPWRPLFGVADNGSMIIDRP